MCATIATNQLGEPAERQEHVDLLPVRMINEFVYCPRLYYLMHVMQEWAPSVDTEEGKRLHRIVDRRQERFPEAHPGDPEDPRRRARSVMLGSDSLGVIAKMDVVEHAGGIAVPVEYKHGRPPANQERSWLPERVQLCAQALILEDHGWRCERGVLYFPESRERVEVEFDDSLRLVTMDAIERAREAEAGGELPPPLEDSPKCPRCSLVGICLPDETNLLLGATDGEEKLDGRVRRLIPGNDDRLPVHLTAPGARVSVESQRLLVREPDGTRTTLRMKDLSQVNLYGGIQVTTQAIQRLLRNEVPLGYFTSGGWFYGVCKPIGHSAVQLRRRQYARSADPAWSLRLAKAIVRNKIRNARTMLRRNHRAQPSTTLERLRDLAVKAEAASSMECLLGIEGLAAKEYFSQFSGMLNATAVTSRGFQFNGRNRRPPADPVNAMLSMAYSVLVRHFTAACAIVGLDPHVGYYHADRPGRPSLALDLMEPFRPLLADSAVIMAVNNGEMSASDFVTVGPSCTFTANGRKRFIAAFERRLAVECRHPVFGYRITYRRTIEVQTRLLARHIFGELDQYSPYETR